MIVRTKEIEEQGLPDRTNGDGEAIAVVECGTLIGSDGSKREATAGEPILSIDVSRRDGGSGYCMRNGVKYFVEGGCYVTRSGRVVS